MRSAWHSRWRIMTALLLVILAARFAARPAWRAVRRLVLASRAQAAWANAQEHGTMHVGAPALWLSIENAGIETPVLLGTSEDDLLRFPCLTSIGDTQGGMLISAHRDMHFRRLESATIGDMLEVETLNRRRATYRIEEVEVLDPDDAFACILERASEEWIVLATCYPFRYIGPAPQRYLVWAHKIDTKTARL